MQNFATKDIKICIVIFISQIFCNFARWKLKKE